MKIRGTDCNRHRRRQRYRPSDSRALAKEGADVAIIFHTDKNGAEETARRVKAAGRRAFVTQTDVGVAASVKALVEGKRSALGVVDHLTANAGKGMSGMPVAEMEVAKLQQILQTDLVGPFPCARSFVQARKAAGGGGRLLIIGSVAGHLPTPGSAPHGMAKAGVNSLVHSLSVEVAPYRINVNAIARLDRDAHDPGTDGRLSEARGEHGNIPWRRPGQPEETAGLAVFLLSDAADYITGQTWAMDGGLTMNWGARKQAFRR